MSLAAGARLGPYEIESLIGTGGMGEVYKGRDSRLDRLVAIKLLHPALAERPDRRARFEAEARAISALNHPHICSLFDVGEQDGRAFLVMEYLEGETLEDRLTRGALPPTELVPCALQIADALEHAHAEHIVHRDVKPSNVMLTAAGVKLLDFGLAKQPVTNGVAPGSTVSLDQRQLTVDGTLVGTFQYMAPEQLEGKRADQRTDVFAFGAMLYEMATGHRAFEGGSQASLIASILTAQPPPISAVRPSVGSSLLPLDHIAERCLAKDPGDRWQTIRDVKLELEWLARGSDRLPPRWESRRVRPREATAWALVALGATAAISYTMFHRPAPGATTRFVVAPPSGVTIGIAENRTRLAMSPDGRRLAFIGTKDGRQQIWIQALDSVTATPLAGTDGAVSPFWSPDSRFVGFFSTADGQLKKIEPSGGAVLTICAAQMDGAPVWGRDGTILFTEFPGGGIHRVAATGGTPVPVTTIDKTRRELNHYWPEFLPDGRHFLYLATGLDATGLRATPGVYVASFDPGEAPRLLARTHSKMIAAVSGYLLFVQDGAILAQRFDADTRQLSGEPIRVADGVGYFRTLGNGAFTLSATGELAYLGNATPIGFTWYDRKGAASNTGWEPQNVGSIRMSPDGHRIVADISDPAVGTADIWIYDADRGAPVRLTTDLMNETQPIWSPGAQRVLFRWERGGSPNVDAKTVGSGAEEQLVVDPSPLTPEDWSPDGKWIAYVRNTRQTALDLWLMPLEGERTPRPFSTERFDEWGAKFSPDSRWVAFASTESGSPEVYVAPRGAPGDRQRISVGGGSTPRWRADGRELFYVTPDNRAFMAVPVQATTTFTAGTPARLFSLSLPAAARDRARNVVYDVTPDGQRFLIGAQAGEASTSRITVVMNWTSAVLR